MGIATLFSKVLGLFREMAYAALLGAGPVFGAFVLANMIPNLFRRLLGEGVLTASFIPIFKEKEIQEGTSKMWASANAVISGLISSAFLVCLLVFLGLTVILFMLPVILAWVPVELAPGLELTLRLLRIMFPYMLLVCLAAVLMGMLNSRGYFFIPAMGATMLNVVMIITVLFVAPRFGETPSTQVYALAFGILVAGVLQVLFQLPLLYKDGFRFQWINPWNNETVRRVVSKMIPGTIGVAAYQINMLTTQSVAALFDFKIVGGFNYAVRFMELPQGVFTISLATFLLPTLSGFAAKKDYRKFTDTLNEGVHHVVFFNLFASVIMIILAEPIVRLVFERGNFTPADTVRVALALKCLAPGLVAFSLVNIFARGFFALGDTSTPMKISAVCLALNLVFTISALFALGNAGSLGLANSLSAFFHVWLLIHAFKLKLKDFDAKRLTDQLHPILLAVILSGLSAAITLKLFQASFSMESFMARVTCVFLPALVSLSIYLALGGALKVRSALEILQLFEKKWKSA